MSTITAGEVFAQATEAISKGDVDGWLAHCRDDVVVEFPYAPPGRPTRVAGKAAVGDYLREVPAQIEFEQITSMHIHQTVDSETAIIEWSAQGRIKSTGAPYEMTYVVVLTLVEGLIAVYRDYWNPLTVLEALETP